ncbi:MAG: SRPBCC family protein [Pseudomonadota bacterium]
MKRVLQISLAAAFVAGTALYANTTAKTSSPPNLAKPSKYMTNEEVIFLPTDPESAWAFWTSTPITDFLKATDRIPAIDSIEPVEGEWGTPGAIRRVNLADGGTVLERVLTADEDEFTYQIWDIETGAGRFINHIYGEFRLRAVEGGSEITWRYNVKPAIFIARPFIRRYLNNDFDPFMEGGMAGMKQAFEAGGS